MTTIERIKDALQAHIAEAEAATPGPWRVDRKGYDERPGISTFDQKRTIVLFGWKYDDNDDGGIRGKDPKEALANATFIAHARTMSPAACKCLLLAIEGLERHEAHIALESIRQEWHNLTTQ